MAASLKLNDNVRHIPSGLLGTVYEEPQSDLFLFVLVDYVPPGAWLSHYGTPQFGHVLSLPREELRRE